MLTAGLSTLVTSTASSRGSTAGTTGGAERRDVAGLTALYRESKNREHCGSKASCKAYELTV